MTTTATIARQRGPLRFSHKELTPLTDKELMHYAPSVFTEEPRPDYRKSGRYQHVHTYELVQAMRAEGFFPVEVQTYRRLDPKRVPYAMHMLRFAEMDSKHHMREVGDVAPQIVMRNSHDGSSRFEIWSALFRKVCSNGLIVSDSDIVQPIHVRHSARVVLEAMAGVLELVERQKGVMEYIGQMRAIKMAKTQQIAFAAKALELRPNLSGVLPAEALLAERRVQDKGDDLWRVYNRVQENLMQGGMERETANKRKLKVSAVNCISAGLGINAHLWSLSMQVIAKAASTSKAAVEGEVVSTQ